MIRSSLVRYTRHAIGGAVVLAVAVLASDARADKWDLASPYPEGSYQTKNNRLFAKDVKRMTDGRVVITVHAAASLFKLPEIKRAVQTGQIAMGELLLGALANDDPIHGVGMMPFLTRHIDDAKALWTAQRPFVAKRLDRQDLMLLHGVIWPGQSLFTTKKIDSFNDIKGMKFRVQNPTTALLAKHMGVTGVRVETVDIPQSFLTGIINGMYTSNVTTANLKGWDYVKFTYEANAWYPKNITFVNKKMFGRLEKRDQDTVLEASRIAEKRGWGMEASETKQKTALLRKNGVTVTDPSANLKQEFQAIGKKMTTEWTKAAGADGQKLLDTYKKARPK